MKGVCQAKSIDELAYFSRPLPLARARFHAKAQRTPRAQRRAEPRCFISFASFAPWRETARTQMRFQELGIRRNAELRSAPAPGVKITTPLGTFSTWLRSFPVASVTVCWRLNFGGLLRSVEGISTDRLNDTLSLIFRQGFHVFRNGVQHRVQDFFVFWFCGLPHINLRLPQLSISSIYSANYSVNRFG